MPDEEVREEQDSTHEPREQLQGGAAWDEAAGETRSLTASEQPMPPEAIPPSLAASSAEGGRKVMPTVSSRKEQFLIAKKSGPLLQDVQPVDLSGLEQALKAGDIAGAAHVRTLSRRGRVAMEALRAGATGTDTIIVAEMPSHVADQLRQHPGLVVEPDHPLVYAQPALPVPVRRDPGVVVPYSTGFSVSLNVLGEGGSPLEGAEVYLYGAWWPVQGVTDAGGRVQLTLFGESPNTMRALYVKPKADYWSLWITQPALDPAQENTVFLTPLTQTFANFPQQQLLGWGQKAMKVDQLPPHYRGQGVKVAVIDSGIATSHRDLQQVKGGYDTLTQSDTTWTQDTLAHGTHTAGVIAGNLDNAIGIRGIAPDAELYAYKIFPDGRFSNLIDALNLCIEQQIDVVNLSLGSAQRSELVEQKIQEAKRLGVACIVAAGNSGGPVQYPATSPHVLAVAAVGKQGEFPPESYHGTQVLAGNGRVVSSDGFFSARFTCFGPEVGVCAPGVAILSSVPPDNFAVWDGTSMAAPHVTGLAALVLAHHADFQGAYKARNASRVERLFQTLKQSAQPLNLGDPYRVGAGLPDALQALSLAPPAAAGMPTSIDELVRQLLETVRRGTMPVGVRGLAAAGTPGATLQDLKAVMRQAGLLTGNGGPAPQSTAGSGTPGATLQDLKAVMRQAGLLAGGSGAVALPRSRPDGEQPTLRELKATLQQVGLL